MPLFEACFFCELKRLENMFLNIFKGRLDVDLGVSRRGVTGLS